MNPLYYVEVSQLSDGLVVEHLGPMPERKAEKVARGIAINMNHERFAVHVVQKEEEPTT